MPQPKRATPTVITANPSRTAQPNNPSGEIVTGMIGSVCAVIGTLIGESLAKLLERKCSR
ncbi:hypothetical protein [Methylovulum psychrotolerans]|uniref:hypothetical protein n=1 Tax=Methylovulum psychrotolerans TaxID=1704499 RepID=UPI0012F7B868|nr:hypothetical protein [Methylovulum psychrotolerans]